MIQSKKQMYIIIGAFVLTLLLGTTTYAFFNYTRTGTQNVLRTGRVNFSSVEGNDTVTLSDLFPITIGPNETITSSTPGVGSLSIHVTGDTSYTQGIEYRVRAVNVTDTGGATLPISVSISYEANTGKTIGTPDEDYFDDRGSTTSYYKVLSTDTITNNGDLIVGYIAPDQNGIDGNIVIMAYLDANNIAITDTNPDVTYYGVVDNLSAEELTACETYLNAASGYCSSDDFQDDLDDDTITAAQKAYLLEHGYIEELYTDGTTSEWVRGRTVFTTEEWNELQSEGVSFQVKVEANEGIWVPSPGSATLSLSPANGTIDMSTATTTTSTITSNGNGTRTCLSSSSAVATCEVNNNTLTVTGVGNGIATITVIENAGTLFTTAATATYDVTVTNAS